ncbi:MAG: hypothetical protein GQ552_00735 [Flavobacteriaceae bacterium]|nr:hypothetical protein [Flavobacteriaceae bacterium]
MKDKNQVQKDPNTKVTEDEIDLGQLFTLIGKGFSNLFHFVGSIFTSIFNWFLFFLLFIRSNAKKIFIGAFVGAILGGIYHYGYKPKTYESSMTVQPNFGSAVQLYKNIDFYQSLIKQNDIDRLASSLKITSTEAESLTYIEVKPYSNENQTLLSYKNFIKDLDTNTVKLINYKSFAKEQPIESFRYHIVTITSKDKYLFTKLEVPIINSIIRNTYYDKVKTTAYSNLISRKVALEGSMVELDSLRSLYKKVMLAESKKENSGTNVFMSETGSNSKEVVVFDKFMDMNQLLIDVNKKLTEENEVINVVSSFNAIGMKVGSWYRNNVVLGFAGGFLLVLLIISLKELNQALTKFDEKKKV